MKRTRKGNPHSSFFISIYECKFVKDSHERNRACRSKSGARLRFTSAKLAFSDETTKKYRRKKTRPVRLKRAEPTVTGAKRKGKAPKAHSPGRCPALRASALAYCAFPTVQFEKAMTAVYIQLGLQGFSLALRHREILMTESGILIFTDAKCWDYCTLGL